MPQTPSLLISPHPIAFDLKGLLWTLVRTDFKTRYHGSWFGLLWSLLKPLLLLSVLLGVFSYVFPQEPFFRFKMVLGLFLWEFFAEGTKVGIVALHQKAYLLTKTQMPRWIVVVTSLANPLFTLCVYCTAVIGLLLASGKPLSIAAFSLFFVYVLHLLIIVLGISLVGSVLFLYWKDLNQVWEVVVTAGFFFTPIIFPIGVLPERLHALLYIWPPTPIIMFAREVLLDGTVPSLKAHLLLSTMALTVFSLGCAVYRLAASRIAERL